MRRPIGRDGASRQQGDPAVGAGVPGWGRAAGASSLVGPLEALQHDDRITDILVNGPDEVWVDRGAGLLRTRLRFGGHAELRAVAQRLAAACGRRLDDASPYVDARLPDGTRVHAVLPPIARRGPYLSLRLFRRQVWALPELVPADEAALLSAIVAARLAFVVTGSTGSGKTTVLNALLGEVPPTERIVVVEDSAELRPAHPHVLVMEARTPNVEGTGAVTLRDLVRQALRMRPDRIVVGECRGPEVVELLTALNTGHEGGAGTLHANTPADVPARFEALALSGGLDRAALHAQLGAAALVVVHLRRSGSHRVLDEVCLLRPAGEGLVVARRVWGRTTGLGPGARSLAEDLEGRGVPVPGLLLGDYLTRPLSLVPDPGPSQHVGPDLPSDPEELREPGRNVEPNPPLTPVGHRGSEWSESSLRHGVGGHRESGRWHDGRLDR
ncbi:TadA family conjugal transfer-associated ATPase [Longispora urticae]